MATSLAKINNAAESITSWDVSSPRDFVGAFRTLSNSMDQVQTALTSRDASNPFYRAHRSGTMNGPSSAPTFD